MVGNLQASIDVWFLARKMMDWDGLSSSVGMMTFPMESHKIPWFHTQWDLLMYGILNIVS